MSEYLKIKYAATNEAVIYSKISDNKPAGKPINKILMNTWLGVLEESGDWYRVVTAGDDGWIRKSDTKDVQDLKLFFIDVQQGDGALLEVGDKRILIDAGPNQNFYNYLTKYQYSYLLNANKPVYIDKIFISHFDYDHYNGFIKMLNDSRFHIGELYHNGLARFASTNGKRPAGINKSIGRKEKINGEEYIVTYFDSISDIKKLLKDGGLNTTFNKFLQAVLNAHEQGRLKEVKRLYAGMSCYGELVNNKEFKIEILGPVVHSHNSKKIYKWFDSESETINGHSLVLKIKYGNTSILMAGDLNSKSEAYLMEYYKNKGMNPFEVDIAKSCHHGSSDFLVEFLQKINPYATVISSGDNENYSHPRADAIGCAGKYSKGDRPLVFSTELARSINSAKKILYGMINLRSDGDKIFLSQMKEKRSGYDIWDSYEVKKNI